MKKIRIGVIGCGTIAQIMYLPYLRELEQFETKAICDISSKLVNFIGEAYGIEERYTDYHKLLESDIDAVIVLTLYHSDICIAAAKSQKHILVEKPMCTSPEEADEIINVARENGVKLMVGYMKRYDPGYIYGQKLLSQMKDIRLIHAHDICHENIQIINEVYDIARFADIPREFVRKEKEKYIFRVHEALGEVPDECMNAYNLLLGLGSHDATILRGAFGDPQEVIFTDIWQNGGYICSILKYQNNKRAIFEIGFTKRKWFDEELVAFGLDKTVRVKFPSPYLKNAPTIVEVQEMKNSNIVDNYVYSSYEESFKRQLKHFYNCIINNKQPLTSGERAKKDIELLASIVKQYIKRKKEK